MSYFTPTDEQREVIDFKQGAALVKAPPGAGKTLVLTERIVRILSEPSDVRFRVLALTFTTRAAEEMRERIRTRVQEEWRRVSAGTFHAFALDVLSHYGDEVGFQSRNSIYERESDRLDTLERALEDVGWRASELEKGGLQEILGAISVRKRDLTAPTDVPPDETVAGVVLAEIYDAYNSRLRENNAYDFDDLLFLCHHLLATSPWTAKHYREMYRYILVDEAQDTSKAQYEILRVLCGEEHDNVMLVGDPDQYIYRFAGASSRFMGEFARDFRARTFVLTKNFRSASAIVVAANRLAEHLPDDSADALVMSASGRAPGKVEAASYPDEHHEARAVADLVSSILRDGVDPRSLHDVESPGCAAEEVCVLGRARYVLAPVVTELRQREMPFVHNTGRLEMFESAAFKFVYHGLRLLQNPADAMGRRSLLRECCGEDEEHAVGDPAEPLTALFQHVGDKGDGALGRIAGAFRSQISSPLELDELVASLRERAAALGGIEASDPEDEEELARVRSDLHVFGERWQKYREKTTRDGRTLAGLLGELALGGRSGLENDGVRVLTVHAAKGLEFKVVIIVGLNEGSFPDFRARSPQELAEERRSMYVAATRAGRELYLTRARQRTNQWGRVFLQQPSRFIGELGVRMRDR